MARHQSTGSRYFLILTISLLSVLTSSAGGIKQEILNPRFKTLKVEKEEEFMSPPVIALNGQDRIVISFDEIGEDYTNLQFRLIHCNSDWHPSRLLESEYVDGFNYDDIEDYAFSSNTFVHYVNYRFTVPSENLRPLVSGNYIVEVYPQSDPDDVILRARIQVSEERARITGESSPRTDRGFNSEWQQLTFAVDAPGQEINPYTDLIVSVTQNRRPDMERILMHPMRVEGNKAVYEHQTELIFPASNEYRRFETVRADYPGMGVENVDFQNRRYHALLKQDEGRYDHEYIYDQTQQGRYMIDEYNATDPDLGADYVTVHFSLDFPELINGAIYVDGDFSNNVYSDDYRMTYNRDKGLYELSIPLKQGSYNYQYVGVKENGDYGDTSLVEGNKYETINEYNISVYYKAPTARAERLIGTGTIISKP